MKKVIFSLVVLTISVGQLVASERLNLLYETFSNVFGPIEATEALDQSQLDNPEGWSFTNAFAGPECVIIKKGGSVTTPAIPELTGNVSFYFSARWWEDPNRIPEEEPSMVPHSIALIGNGEISTNEYDTGTSHMDADVIYDADGTSRIKFTANYDIMMDNVCIYYAGYPNADAFHSDYTEYSHETGDYFTPFDLTLIKSTAKLGYDDGLHNILVYTTDGTDPVRTSTRYEGTPIHIANTTTVKTATIFGNGYMSQDKSRVYTFPTAETPEKPANTYEITVSKPGNLKAQLLDLDADVIEGLVIKGKINGTDLNCLGSGEGLTASLIYLDMSELTFEFDNTIYRTVIYAPEGGMGTTTILHYYLSNENRSETVSGSPTHYEYNVYRNNLAAAFRNHPSLQAVILPSSIPSLGESMFESCRELISVQFPENLTIVGSSVFNNCSNLKLYDFPTTFEEIGGGAFAGTKLGNVRLDKKVKIGDGAFSSSTIAKFDMPLPPDTIPDYLLANCYNLEEINIGEGAKYIGYQAFTSTKLKVANLPQSIEEIYYGAFAECPFIKNIEPEDGIRYIGRVAYELTDNTRQEYTVKPGTVSLVSGLFAFTNATSYNLPTSLEIIGSEAFAVTQLTSLPEMPSVKRIGAEAFRHSTKLARAIIPESVEYIGNDIFEGCNALWSITYNAIDAECVGKLSSRNIERIVIGDKVRRLPAGLYTGNTNVTEVILPKSVEILDPEVFHGCENLEYIRLSDNITTISDHAFYSCYSLKDIHWPINLKTIGNSAFENCISLKTISLPEGMESVGYNAFEYCSGVENLYVASTIDEFEPGCFTFDNAPTPITITATAKIPQDCEWNWYYMGPTTIKVPAESLAAYQNNANWNGSLNGKTNLIIPIEGISASQEKVETSFNTGIDSETDLADAVVGDVYVTIGEDDGYDETDGSIVLNSSMDEEYMEAIGGMAPGESDLAHRFNGLVVQVPEGTGKITINCMTIGNKRISVKIGDNEPEYYTKNSKGDITIDYSVPEDTYVYIYASEANATGTDPQTKARTRVATGASDNSVKIYSVGVNPVTTGIGSIDKDKEELSPIIEYYRIDGSRVTAPTAPGIYIIRRANGESSKIMVR